jgi:hypothetical protein
MSYIRRRSQAGDQEDPGLVGALKGKTRNVDNTSSATWGWFARNSAKWKSCSSVKILEFERPSIIEK